MVQVDVDDGDLAQACREAEKRVACRDRRVVEQAEPLRAVHPVAGSWLRHEAKGASEYRGLRIEGPLLCGRCKGATLDGGAVDARMVPRRPDYCERVQVGQRRVAARVDRIATGEDCTQSRRE